MQSLLPPVAAAGTTGPDLGNQGGLHPQCPDLTKIHQEGRTESPPLTPRWNLTSSLPTICAAPVSSCLPLASRLWPLLRALWLFGLLRSCCVPVWSWGRPHPAFLETPAHPLTGTQMGTGLGGLQVAGDGLVTRGPRGLGCVGDWGGPSSLQAVGVRRGGVAGRWTSPCAPASPASSLGSSPA